MADLVINFDVDPSAVTYKITYRLNSGGVVTDYTTTSPYTVTGISCGTYTGTVTAVCDEGTDCIQYTISNPDMYSDGDVEYVDCTTGNLVTQAVTPGGSFTVCSRTVPTIFNGAPGATVSAGGSCGKYDVQESAPVNWSQTISCNNYYLVSACDPEAPLPANNEVRSPIPLSVGDTVVELLGSAYAGYYYQITDVGGPQTSSVLVGIVYDNQTCASAPFTGGTPV